MTRVYLRAYGEKAFVVDKNTTVRITKQEPEYERIDLIDGEWLSQYGPSARKQIPADMSDILDEIVKHYKLNLLKTIVE